MNRFLLAALATSLAVVGLTGMEVGAQRGPDGAAQEKRAAAADTKRAEQLKSLADAARDTFAGITDDYQIGRGDIEEVYAWSSRWRVAAVKAAITKDEVLQANSDHLERMQKLHGSVKALNEQGIRGGEHHKLRAAKYFLTEAELLLSESELASFAMRR